MILIKGAVYSHVRSKKHYILIDTVPDVTNRCASCDTLAMAHECSDFKKTPLEDAPMMVLYFSIAERKFYARRMEEFIDGRFERT